jgi:ABC-type oligopeptide transport system substrate-binding subunit
VEVRLTAVEFKSLLQDIDSGDVEVFRSSWLGDYNDAYTFAQYFKSNFGINLPRYRSTEYDSLVSAAATEIDTKKRQELLQDAERVVLRDHPLIPLYFYVNKHLVKPEVDGWYDNVMNVVYSSIWACSSSLASQFLPGEIVNEAAIPIVNVVALDRRQHLLVPLAPLSQRHGQRSL